MIITCLYVHVAYSRYGFGLDAECYPQQACLKFIGFFHIIIMLYVDNNVKISSIICFVNLHI